jgi:predicted  nucleic acid-binding Zn-ribbon protein
MDDLNRRLHHLEERVRTLERERENDQQTIKKLQDKISSRKRRRYESGDQADEKLEEESRKYRHLGTLEEPIVLEVRRYIFM